MISPVSERPKSISRSVIKRVVNRSEPPEKPGAKAAVRIGRKPPRIVRVSGAAIWSVGIPVGDEIRHDVIVEGPAAHHALDDADEPGFDVFAQRVRGKCSI